MKKNKKSQKQRISAVKRGAKRTARLKQSAKLKVIRKEALMDKERVAKAKQEEALMKILASRKV